MTHEFRTLGQSLGETIGDGRHTPIIAPSLAKTFLDRIREGGFQSLKDGPTLLDLIAAPGTQQARMSLEAARTRHAELSASPVRYRREIARTLTEIEAYTVRYARALERDRLQEGRPVGCWCLGYGGRNPYYKPMPTGERVTEQDGSQTPEIEEIEILSIHCEYCPEGASRAEYDHDRLMAYEEVRNRQAVIRRFGEANLPLEYRRWPWRDHPDSGAVRRVLAWLDDPKTDRDAHHWILLYGPGGRGKTTILAGLAAELAESGASVLFRTMPDLIGDIRATFGKPDEQEKLRDLLKRVRHLFLDDIGADVPRDWIGEFLYEILNHRHNEHMPTYMSTNLWDEADGLDPFIDHMGIRLWGRIKRMAEPVRMVGQDLRELPHVSRRRDNQS